MKLKLLLISLLDIFCIVLSDVYMHVPRGSNNRLNEKSATRTNGNRVFDSQNNARGGYNVGDKTDKPSGGDEENQYRMKYFQSGKSGNTLLTLEWTNQHGCGGNDKTDPHKLNCDIVIQYMCQKDVASATGTVDTLRNGVNTGTQNYKKPPSLTEPKNGRDTRKTAAVNQQKVLQESWDDYDKCFVRERNRGLFTADQKLTTNNGLGYSSSIYTRQNPNGNRRGYECPEERDYYPYWHPTSWKDVAILTDKFENCGAYRSKSFNVKKYGECVEYYDNGKTQRKTSRWNNQAECKNNGGDWIEFSNYLEKAPQYKSPQSCAKASQAGVKYIWAVPYDATNVKQAECLVALDSPDCKEAPWTRSNHLGNTREGIASSYTWKIPYFPSGDTQRCVIRLRYNISTDDYDPFKTDSKSNENTAENKYSPIENNPYVELGMGHTPLRLAINTAQTGRVFQDRSHVFKLLPRSKNGVPDNLRILNLNVRGKRGNIVQVYPAVEYDFAPNELKLKTTDAVHIQWTGSNTHNNDKPGGDGQTGDDGQGTGGTDRNNIVEIMSLNENYPTPFEHSTLWNGAEIIWVYHGKKNIKPGDLGVSMASSGYYRCLKKVNCPENAHAKYLADTKTPMNNLLNNAPASFEGAVLRFKVKGAYHYMCSRNNNFTNRSQKGSIIVQ